MIVSVAFIEIYLAIFAGSSGLLRLDELSDSLSSLGLFVGWAKRVTLAGLG